MTLDPATESDFDALADLVNSAFRGAAGWTTEAGMFDGPRTTAAALAEQFGAGAEATLLVWRDAPDAEPVGCVWVGPLGDGVWKLGLLSVRPEVQERKLGRTVLEAAEAWARDRGARRIRLQVIGVKDELVSWYQRRGYVLTGETLPFPYDDPGAGGTQRRDLDFVLLEKPV